MGGLDHETKKQPAYPSLYGWGIVVYEDSNIQNKSTMRRTTLKPKAKTNGNTSSEPITIDWYRKQVKSVADAIGENRSDISEMLHDILEGKEPKTENLESRIVEATLPNGIVVEYDTLTTLFSIDDGTGLFSSDGIEHRYTK